jgi:peptide/nickel transport system substrate-binding protein
MAALLSGEIDFVLDPPPQDIGRLKQDSKIKVLEGMENRTIFLGMDQWRDELQYSSVKGKNPFKDKRVREAVQSAIDVQALKTQVMRGLSVPTAVMYAPQVDGYPKEIDKVKAPDRAKAKKLLADAGYPNGFDVTLDCPNNRYVNDEKLCVAIAAMLAQVEIKVRVNSMPRATTSRRSSSWTPASTCSAGACRRSTRSTRCSRSCARASRRRRTATTTSASTRTRRWTRTSTS